MAGRPPATDFSPETDIKILPRGIDLPPLAPPPQRRHGQHPPPRHPPRNYQPFRKWFPWLVPTIVVISIALFVMAMYLNNCPANISKDDTCVVTSNNVSTAVKATLCPPQNKTCVGADILGRFSFQPMRENLLLGPRVETLSKMGALVWSLVVVKKQVWRLASCMWLHGGLFHLLVNMLSLVLVGIRLEKEFGFMRIGTLYIMSGIGGSLLSSLFVQGPISVGASGALFGLLGGMLSELLINWTIYENKAAALLTLLLIIIVNLGVGILPHVDNFAHLGGFIAGFLQGFVLLIRPQFRWINQHNVPPGYFAKNTTRSKYNACQYILMILALILLIASFTTGLVLLMKGIDGNDYCSWCHYLSCVPTPLWKCVPQEPKCMAGPFEGHQVTLTCLLSNETRSWPLDGNTTSQLRIRQLCTEFCTYRK